MSKESPSSYDYVALPDRRPFRFPNGARLALIITINLEYWEKSRQGQKEPLFTGGPMTGQGQGHIVPSVRNGVVEDAKSDRVCGSNA